MKDAEIVCAFLERIAAHDCDGALEFLVDDVFIHNMPLPPTRTREEWLQGMMAFGGDLEIDLLNIVDRQRHGDDRAHGPLSPLWAMDQSARDGRVHPERRQNRQLARIF